MSIKRYNMKSSEMVEDNDGDWVKYKDYVAESQRMLRILKEVDNTLTSVKNVIKRYTH